MVKVEQIAFENSLKNFSYLVNVSDDKFYCIDPWDGPAIAQVIDERYGGKLSGIINTHDHYDHCRGNEYLQQCYRAKVLSTQELDCGDISYLKTPGHTMDHVAVIIGDQSEQSRHVFLGDTIFHYGVGNCKNGGDPEVLAQTLKKLISELRGDDIIWVGHNYGEQNFAFSQSLSPQYQKSSYVSADKLHSWQQEMSHNVFLRIFDKTERDRLHFFDKELEDLKCRGEDSSLFIKLRTLRDRW